MSTKNGTKFFYFLNDAIKELPTYRIEQTCKNIVDTQHIPDFMFKQAENTTKQLLNSKPEFRRLITDLDNDEASIHAPLLLVHHTLTKQIILDLTKKIESILAIEDFDFIDDSNIDKVIVSSLGIQQMLVHALNKSVYLLNEVNTVLPLKDNKLEFLTMSHVFPTPHFSIDYAVYKDNILDNLKKWDN